MPGSGAKVEAALDAVLRWSPAQLVFRSLNARRLTVLAYHGIDDPRRFEQQLAYLSRATHPVSLDEVLDHLAGRRTLPERSVLVTFDDGHRSVLELALPRMTRHGIPGVAFVVVGLLDTDDPFWWTEVEGLARHGGTLAARPGATGPELVALLKRVPDADRLTAIEELRRTASEPASRTPQLRRDELAGLEAGGIAVESHSITHPMLSRCGPEKLMDEVGRSRAVLEDALGHDVRAFAYPDGDCDIAAREAVANAGYRAAFLFDHRINGGRGRDPLRVSRVRVNAHSSMDRFVAIVSGLHPFVHHARGGR